MSPEVERRRRLITRTLPLALVAFVAFSIGAALGAPGSPEKEAADRFGEAWSARNYKAMYRELNDDSKAKFSLGEFADAYQEAAQTSTLRGIEPASPQDPQKV